MILREWDKTKCPACDYEVVEHDCKDYLCVNCGDCRDHHCKNEPEDKILICLKCKKCPGYKQK